MSDPVEIIDITPDVRVRIEIMQYPDPPEDEGAAPILRYEPQSSRGGYKVTTVEYGSYVVNGQIIRALERWAGEPDTFDRYLRIYHGATQVKWFGSRGWPEYVCFDTAQWREQTGITDEVLAAHPDVADMGEWIGYVEGDVYGYIVERLVTWAQVGKPEIVRQEWEDTGDSCWGFYGDVTYVLQEATIAGRTEAGIFCATEHCGYTATVCNLCTVLHCAVHNPHKEN